MKSFIYAPRGKRRIAYQTTLDPFTLTRMLARLYKTTLTFKPTAPEGYTVRPITDLKVKDEQLTPEPPRKLTPRDERGRFLSKEKQIENLQHNANLS